MIFWDKCRNGMDFSDGEIAWTDLEDNVRQFTFKWNGMIQGDMKNKEERIHPTQKPVTLYAWILDRYARPGYKILDTHAGSASSGVACAKLGYEYWGFEIDPDYYAEARERLDRARNQISMFEMDPELNYSEGGMNHIRFGHKRREAPEKGFI